MLALPNSRLTSAGERQSALTTCRYHANTGSRASAYAASRSQKSRKVDRAITRIEDDSPKLGLVQTAVVESLRSIVLHGIGRTAYARTLDGGSPSASSTALSKSIRRPSC